MTPSGSNPGDTPCSRTKLRTSRPAPTSSTSEIATSATTSRLRSRRRELPKPPSPCVFLPPAFSDVLRSTCAARSAGARPNSRPVKIEIAEREGEDGAVERDRVEPRDVARD